ncbi:Proline-rich protein 3 [Morella rubra]|uniref:Proline-rich protein 3 n=1 Tax=Morella rubra TaxID=262757 RepID=A0A6A1WN65_9ROSI|nr:Proline-rich protein 3 [Morella rubra]
MMALTARFFQIASLLLLMVVLTASAVDYGYGPISESEHEIRRPEGQRPEEKEKEMQFGGKQGLVFCKSGPNFFQLQGAVARITCQAIDNHAYNLPPFSILSCETYKTGYFFASFSSSGLEDKVKATDCKAFPHSSQLENCKVPTDVNHGLSGALLASPKILEEKKMKLYSVGPFFYYHQTETK